jgi:hypothetical protein
MFSTLHKKLVWAIVIWFAAMQMISPLMHAHVEADSPTQGVGMHVHMQQFEQAGEKVAAFENANDAIHIIGVNQAYVKDIKLLIPPVLAILFFLLALPVLKTHFKPSTRRFTALPFYLRPDSRPRAPPLF